MFKSVFYKEWLKIRWAYALTVLLSILAPIYIVLSLNSIVRFNSPIAVWSVVVQQSYLYYDIFRFVPTLIGYLIAGFQFVPESTSSRLKLSLHLPVRENTIVLQMLSVGLIMVGLLFVFIALLLSTITAVYFPSEVLTSVLLTIAPWILAGIISYLVLSAVIIEPRWIRRVILFVIGSGFVNALLIVGSFKLYERALLQLAILGSFFALGIIFSAHRFRRGVR